MTCDPQALAKLSNGFKAVPEGNKLNILIYLFAVVANVTTDPETLSRLGNPFKAIPEGNKMNVLLYLACNFSGGGGGGTTCVSGGVGSPVGAPPCTWSIYTEQPVLPKTIPGLWINVGAAWFNVLGTGPL